MICNAKVMHVDLLGMVSRRLHTTDLSSITGVVIARLINALCSQNIPNCTKRQFMVNLTSGPKHHSSHAANGGDRRYGRRTKRLPEEVILSLPTCGRT